MLSEEQKKKAEEEALKAFPDYINENGQLATCSALRYHFIRGYDVGYNDAKKTHKQEWSEEDEERVKETLAIIETVEDINKAKDGFLGAKMWLKSLRPKNNYNPYKEVVESIAEMCKRYDKASHSGLRDFYDNVKVKCMDAKEYDSLYHQNTWKPSDEQMTALRQVISGCSYDIEPLVELETKLKEL